ncbi:PREDICTED: glucose-induced degradation protein 4 homolog isoform X1 [Nelumbo nucifera]|uniref:Glucose-induced degradation protein 4 homolog isoform X1 n=1 Tax=Nelumbo nucifera TaxID=4432 RepID=A0A1U7ZX44_NELNU|nr:PREDICTED: glucose-induced degradation protein 4 homolog isoform X1 [Nelumbo nucifera]
MNRLVMPRAAGFSPSRADLYFTGSAGIYAVNFPVSLGPLAEGIAEKSGCRAGKPETVRNPFRPPGERRLSVEPVSSSRFSELAFISFVAPEKTKRKTSTDWVTLIGEIRLICGMPVRVVESSAPSQVSGASSGHVLPPACTLLSAGQAFSGTQNVSNLQKDEAWRVNVRIQGCDLDHGYLCGTMEALNVPLAETPVVTFWEGEIVDTKNYTFFTGKWEATPEHDVRHWSKFPSFSPLLSQVEIDGGKSLDLSSYPYIFMRWKEQYFVNVGIDCGLTIAGFYYVCFSCSDGSISGFYYDPNSSPFQKLELKSTNEGRSGFSFSSYQLQ